MNKDNCDFYKIIIKSFERSLWILFKPFSIKKWFFLFLIALLSGALGSGGSFNIGDFDKAKRTEAYPVHEINIYQKKDNFSPEFIEELPYIKKDTLKDSSFIEGESLEFEESSKSNSTYKKGKFFPFLDNMVFIFAVIVLLILPCVVLFTWLSSRFKFIWYESIVNNDASIMKPFKKYKKEGNSLFKFFILYGIGWWFCFFSLGIWAYFSAKNFGVFEPEFSWSFAIFFKSFWFQLLGLFLLIFIAVIIAFCVEHFLIPVMAIDRIPFKEGIKNFFNLYKDNQKDFWIFLLLNIGLGILCGVISLILVVMITLILVMAAVLVFGLLYLLVAVFFKLKILFIILATIIGVPFFVSVIGLLMVSALPFSVFFRNLSLFFISSLGSAYEPIVL